jgi:hypothetical protein
MNVTIIAAYWTKDSIAIGADSGYYEQDVDLLVRGRPPKIWKTDNALWGAAGNPRVITVGSTINTDSPYEFYRRIQNSDVQGDWSVLMGRRDGLYIIQSDGAILHVDEPYAAIGNGQAVAMGSLAAINLMRDNALVPISAARAVHTTLAACSTHTASCVEPHKVIQQFF